MGRGLDFNDDRRQTADSDSDDFDDHYDGLNNRNATTGIAGFQKPLGRISQYFDDPKEWILYSVLFVNQLFFGLMMSNLQESLQWIPPTAFTFFRLLFCLPFLGAVAYQEYTFTKTAKGITIELNQKVLIAAAVMGFMGVSLTQTLNLVGDKLAGPQIAGIPQCLVPVWTVMIAAFSGVERITALKGVGVAVAVLGALIMCHLETLGPGDYTSMKAMGVLAVTIETLFYSSFLVMFSHTAAWFPYPFVLFFLCTFFGFGLQLLLAVPAFISFAGWGHVPGSAWGWIFYSGIIVSFLMHSSQMWTVRHLSATVPATFGSIQPIWIFLFTKAFIGGGQIGVVVDVVGILMVVAGITVLVVFHKKEQKEEGRAAAAPSDTYGQIGGGEMTVMDVEMSIQTVGGKDDKDVMVNPMHRKQDNPFDTPMCLVSTIRASRKLKEVSEEPIKRPPAAAAHDAPLIDLLS